MLPQLHQTMEHKMQKAIEVLKTEFAGIRTGRANPALLDSVRVMSYGNPTPLNQVASISAPEPRLLVISPWDRGLTGEIEKAILKSDLGLTPASDGKVIRLSIPTLTEERRKELVKVSKKMSEESKVAVRNIRRDANDEIKKLEKDKKISEDESTKAHEDTQKVTDKYVALIDEVLKKKEKEIMEV
ncbi:MAG: ribosome recycling factor [Candidatus Edwardsbacteria bacterium]|nr:ribosome recycling factor [Candidatus Edwardsbacteria bacterium]